MKSTPTPISSVNSQGLNKKRLVSGFTLIELLIVIAIIGILAAILIPNLLSAKTKAINAAAQGTLIGIKPLATIYYNENGTYTGICATGGVSTIGDQVLAAAQKIDPDAIITVTDVLPMANVSNTEYICAVSPTGDAWFVTIPLRYTGSICIDSTSRTRIKSVDGFAVGSGLMTCI